MLLLPVLEKASPLKSLTPSPSSAILPDIEALESGAPTLKNLQKIALFCNSHPVRPESIVEEDEEERGAFEEEKRVWEGLFDRVMDGLIDFLRPDKVSFSFFLAKHFSPLNAVFRVRIRSFLSKDWLSSGKSFNINGHWSMIRRDCATGCSG